MNPYKYVLMSFVVSIAFTACTLSLTNVSSNGKSEDLLDQTQSPSNEVSAEVPVA